MKNKEMYNWVVKVMRSCTNYVQLLNAKNLIALYFVHFNDVDSAGHLYEEFLNLKYKLV